MSLPVSSNTQQTIVQAQHWLLCCIKQSQPRTPRSNPGHQLRTPAISTLLTGSGNNLSRRHATLQQLTWRVSKHHSGLAERCLMDLPPNDKAIDLSPICVLLLQEVHAHAHSSAPPRQCALPLPGEVCCSQGHTSILILKHQQIPIPQGSSNGPAYLQSDPQAQIP